jgi:hypothetical protein
MIGLIAGDSAGKPNPLSQIDGTFPPLVPLEGALSKLVLHLSTGPPAAVIVCRPIVVG